MTEQAQLCYLGETATGKYPVECVKVMDKVARTIEKSLNYWKRFKNRRYRIEDFDYNFNMNYSVCMSAGNINAKAIIAYTNTGDTPKTVSSFGPECPIFAITSNETTYRQLGLCWNITPKLLPIQDSIDKLIYLGINKLKEENILQKGDIVSIAGGAKAVTDMQDYEAEINNSMGGIIKI